MNKSEFAVFAREAFRHNAADVAVEKIVAQWESDVRDAIRVACEETRAAIAQRFIRDFQLDTGRETIGQ